MCSGLGNEIYKAGKRRFLIRKTSFSCRENNRKTINNEAKKALNRQNLPFYHQSTIAANGDKQRCFEELVAEWEIFS